MLDRHGRRGWSPGGRMPGRDAHVRMGTAGGLLVDGTAEGHLRIGALEDAGDAGAPLELLLKKL